MAEHKIPQKIEHVGDEIPEKLFFNYMFDTYNIDKTTFLEFADLYAEGIRGLPISVLRVSHLSGLESIVKYLRENKKLSYKDISVLLHRNPKTLAVSYAVSKRKRQESYKEFFDKDIARIPFTSFSENLSILESICTHLKSLGHSYAEIGRLVGRDQRTVWTVCDRARKKLSIQKDNYEKR